MSDDLDKLAMESSVVELIMMVSPSLPHLREICDVVKVSRHLKASQRPPYRFHSCIFVVSGIEESVKQDYYGIQKDYAFNCIKEVAQSKGF